MLRFILIDECGVEVTAYEMSRELESALKERKVYTSDWGTLFEQALELFEDEYAAGRYADENFDENVKYPELEEYQNFKAASILESYPENRGGYWEDTREYKIRLF